MITKELFRKILENEITYKKCISNMYNAGVDIINSELNNSHEENIETMLKFLLQDHVSSEEEYSILQDWIWDRVCPIFTKEPTAYNLDEKKPYLWDKNNVVIIENFDSLCEYFKIE